MMRRRNKIKRRKRRERGREEELLGKCCPSKAANYQYEVEKLPLFGAQVSFSGVQYAVGVSPSAFCFLYHCFFPFLLLFECLCSGVVAGDPMGADFP